MLLKLVDAMETSLSTFRSINKRCPNQSHVNMYEAICD